MSRPSCTRMLLAGHGCIRALCKGIGVGLEHVPDGITQPHGRLY